MRKFYQLAERIPYPQRAAFGLAPATPTQNILAILTGEFRTPKAGEWFISGAIPEAYYAQNDLTTAYQIAKLVRTRTVTMTEIDD